MPNAAKPQAGGSAAREAVERVQESGASVDDAAVVRHIDELVRAGWTAAKVRPSAAATDGEWCRRVYLDLVGRVPTVEELDVYVRLRAKGKRAALVERLLGADYRDEYARHWTTVWTNLLIGRTGGNDRRAATSRAGMAAYLADAFRDNKPYDQMVRELVTATGSAQPGADDFNGAVNFLVGKLDEGGVLATAKTAQLFLGQSVQCTQCHNHPFNDGRQNQFWELNAFFRQAKVESAYDDDVQMMQDVRLADVDFAGEGRSGSDTRSEIFLELRGGRLVDRDAEEQAAAPLFYELRNGQVAVAYPAFVDGRSLAEVFASQGPAYGNSGRVSQVHRREELAKLIAESPQLEQAAVNRMWGRLLGYGFANPVDDMGPHNPATHPELLAELAKAFRESGFDMKRLLQWIALSEAYGLSSKFGGANAEDDPSLGKPARFSRFYTRQMEAEQLYESLLAATRADAGLKAFDRDAMKVAWLEQMNTALGNDEGGEATTFNGSIPQALMMMNGDVVRRACETDAGGFLDAIANDERLSDREKFQYLYEAALGRLPGKDEARVCDELLASREGNVVETLQDVWWALLNSGEFILVH